MDSKNVIAAISLSAAVIILYSLFFQPEPEIIKQNLEEKKQIEKTSEAPSLDQNENFSKITRKEALEKDKRIKFENENIVGSISLKGATIDDLTFKQYKVDLDSDKKITLLNSFSNVDDFKQTLTRLENMFKEIGKTKSKIGRAHV